MGAPKGNKYTQKYNEDEAIEVFLSMLEYSKTDECLCIQDAVLNAEMPISTFYNLIEKHKVLEDIKRDIDAAIISKVNRGGLKGDFNPTSAIWRMKQLGEKDKTEVHNKNEDLSPPTPEEMKEAKKRIEEGI